MDGTAERHIVIEGAYNIRDLGGYHTPVGPTRYRRVLRADGLHRLGQPQLDQLRNEGVGTVIDLRRAEELAHAPNPFSARSDVRYHNISLFEQLAPTDYKGDVLHEIYVLALTSRQAQLRAILGVIAGAEDGAVLFHCTAGKDRTGIVAALLLGLAGVTPEDIVEDYAMTGALIAPMIEEMVDVARSRGRDIEKFRPMLRCDPETMTATLLYIEQNFGTMERYLETIGVSQSEMDALRRRLLSESA